MIENWNQKYMSQLTEWNRNRKAHCQMRNRSQFVTLNESRGHHLKYMPHVFTENGIAMLSSVLRSDKAIEVNEIIIEASVHRKDDVRLWMLKTYP